MKKKNPLLTILLLGAAERAALKISAVGRLGKIQNKRDVEDTGAACRTEETHQRCCCSS